MKCPKCGYKFTSENQVKGGKARWRGMTKEQRRLVAKKAAEIRWRKHEKRTST